MIRAFKMLSDTYFDKFLHVTLKSLISVIVGELQDECLVSIHFYFLCHCVEKQLSKISFYLFKHNVYTLDGFEIFGSIFELNLIAERNRLGGVLLIYILFCSCC